MPSRPPAHRPPSPPSGRAATRPTAARRGYGYRWQVASKAFLRRPENVLCATCRLAEATVVDHVRPHRGNAGLFWAEGNWQGLCVPCHCKKTAAGK